MLGAAQTPTLDPSEPAIASAQQSSEFQSSVCDHGCSGWTLPYAEAFPHCPVRTPLGPGTSDKLRRYIEIDIQHRMASCLQGAAGWEFSLAEDHLDADATQLTQGGQENSRRHQVQSQATHENEVHT